MKSMRNLSCVLFVLLAVFGANLRSAAQGTAFTYQGRLNDNGAPANGTYDLRFALFNAATSGQQIGSALTNSAVPVTNGLFTVQLDFGAEFSGAGRWLQIGVRSSIAPGDFTLLSPLQPLTAAPYAITAGEVTAPSVARINNNQVFGGSNYFSGANSLTNPNNVIVGTLSGTLYGNGANLTNINATNLTGNIPASRLPANVALLNRNQTFTGTNTFMSTFGTNKFIIQGDDTVIPERFLGLSLQYDVYGGESAVIASSEVGSQGFLTFYTTPASGTPALRMSIAGDGKVGIGTGDPIGSPPAEKLHVAGNILATGTITPNSDRNAKTDFNTVDAGSILEKLLALPISSWRFKSEDSEIRHVGPVAQDFYSSFGLGSHPTAIATVDADGVALAAIQGLNQKLEQQLKEKQERIQQLEKRLERLEKSLPK